jgi:3-hydroxyisobutyrate dehydrogenase-like beta-hydroxyacid dehydrogenase
MSDQPSKTDAVMRIAFMGLGTMGAPMATHLRRAGHHVCAYNRTTSKAQAWAQANEGQWAATPQEAVADAQLVVSCVGRDEDLRGLMQGPGGVLPLMAQDSIWVDHTTTSAMLAREMCQAAVDHGVHFVDAPVSGGNLGAIQGTLSIMCGGQSQAVQRITPVVMAYAKAVVHIGESGAGQLAKMVNQLCVAGVLQGLAEGLAFGQQAGLDMSRVLQAISQGAASSWQMVNRGPTMLNGQFDFGFAVDWMRKDLGLCLAQANSQGSALPLATLVDQYYAELQAMGGGRWDTSSLIHRMKKTAT